MSNLIVFLKNGKTLLFENATKLNVGPSMIEFTYDGKSTGKTRKATFYTASIAGFAAESNE